MNLTSLNTVKQLLKTNNLLPKKTLGQHFLTNQKALEQIVQAAELNETDIILEVGPGLGTLTFTLARQVKQVIAVEKDKQLAKILQKNLIREKLNNVKIINQDILKFPLDQLVSKSYKLIANLPYQITSPILHKFLHEKTNKPKLMVVMVQREVGERILAQPGQMSRLSVLVQFYSQPSKVCLVKKSQFFPSPQVDAMVIKLAIKKPSNIKEKLFFELVKTGFASKRKTLKNNLVKLQIKSAIIDLAFKRSGLSPNSRAQELAVADWLKLYHLVYN